LGREAKRSGILKIVATHMLRNRADLRHIQATPGHSQISSAEICTHVSLEDLRAMIRRAHPHGKKSQK